MDDAVALPQLDSIKVASPCPMRWERLSPIDGKSADAVRHCASCGLNVFNLEGMTRGEAASLLQEYAGSGECLCAALRRRADGTIITKDCPVGRADWRRSIRRRLGRVAAAVFIALTAGTLAVAKRTERFTPRIRTLQPVYDASRKINDYLQANLPNDMQPDEIDPMLMGEICIPMPAPNVPEEAVDLVYRDLY